LSPFFPQLSCTPPRVLISHIRRRALLFFPQVLEFNYPCFPTRTLSFLVGRPFKPTVLQIQFLHRSLLYLSWSGKNTSFLLDVQELATCLRPPSNFALHLNGSLVMTIFRDHSSQQGVHSPPSISFNNH